MSPPFCLEMEWFGPQKTAGAAGEAGSSWQLRRADFLGLVPPALMYHQAKQEGKPLEQAGSSLSVSLLLIEMQSSGHLDPASLCVKVVLFEEAGNYCSEHSWKEMSWFCVLAMGCFLPGSIQACVRSSVVDRSH